MIIKDMGTDSVRVENVGNWVKLTKVIDPQIIGKLRLVRKEEML